MLTARRLGGLRLAESATARRALLSGTVADGSALSPEAARVMLARLSRRPQPRLPPSGPRPLPTCATSLPGSSAPWVCSGAASIG